MGCGPLYARDSRKWAPVSAAVTRQRLDAYFRPDFVDDDLGGFELGRPPTSMPPIRANENMAWFIFDTFMAASPRH